ncbi:MAG: class I SAM-dependent methyltransferase, partial [Desulfomonilaceae bacterium]
MPDIKDLDQREVWAQRSDLVGIDFRSDEQVAFLLKLGEAYGHECRWPQNPTDDPLQFYTHNGCFSFGCAAALHCVLRYYKPQLVIEIGSGMSSLVISAALRLNANDFSRDVKSSYTIIDPYPGATVTGGLPKLTQLLEQPVELTDVSFFDQLAENDILFIDSSHTVKIGSDVNYLILDVLPRLKPGVVVHFHDINLPYAPPKVYYTNPAFRVFWTEEYLLQ